MENSINRNKVSHLHEVVHQLVHWWDDEIFEQYPTWEEFCRAKNSMAKADEFFGGQHAAGGYATAVKYGIGREVLAKILEGTETRSAIEEALLNLPVTAKAATNSCPILRCLHPENNRQKNPRCILHCSQISA